MATPRLPATLTHDEPFLDSLEVLSNGIDRIVDLEPAELSLDLQDGPTLRSIRIGVVFVGRVQSCRYLGPVGIVVEHRGADEDPGPRKRGDRTGCDDTKPVE